MTEQQWKVFCQFKQDFLSKIEEWTKRCPALLELQKEAALSAKTPEYPFETPVVYNRDLDRFTKDDQIKLIVIGDNPGKDEQLAKNNKYLVGQAGKIADGYFKKNPELGVDFRKNVIILNKTPVHSAKTNQLKYMIKKGGKEVADLILESQLWMAERTAKLHSDLCNCASDFSSGPELWLVGYSELKDKGIFVQYKSQLKNSYFNGEGAVKVWDKVFVFQHFSMNRFTIDLSDYILKSSSSSKSLLQNIHDLGNAHKAEIFG